MAKASKKPKWLQGDAKHEPAIRHPGALKQAAAKHGRSVKQEADVESHSSDKHIRSRGILGKRLIGSAKHGNIGKGKSHGQRKRASSGK